MPKFFALILAVTCTYTFAEDFDINGDLSQIVELEAVDSIQVHCYCSNRIEIIRSNNQDVVLQFTANFSSIGYHGEQRIPESIPKMLSKFDVKRIGASVLLSSKEYTYIHHAFLIKTLRLHVPHGVAVDLIPIEYRQLEGRNNA